MLKTAILTLTGILLLCGSGYSLRQIKIGCVDVEDVFNTYPGIEDIKKKLSEEHRKYQVEIDKRKLEISLLEKDYSLNAKSDDEKLRRSAELELKRQQLGDYIRDSDSRVASFKDDITKPVFSKISAVIEEVSEEKGFSFVFRKGNDIILFIDSEFDITQDVKSRLRKDLNIE
jgi:Skp family chaperone for outer membrane proteins